MHPMPATSALGLKIRVSPGKSPPGSTGVSVEVFVEEAAQQWKRACTLRSDEWSGWRLGQRTAAVWGNPEYMSRGWRGRLRNALLERRRYLDTLKMDKRAMETFASALRRQRPALVFGHAHSLYLIAQFLQSQGEVGIRPRGIISTAMVLHPWERRTIEAVFECPVTNRYGCEEVSLIACECEQHQGMHVNADGVYVEVLGYSNAHADLFHKVVGKLRTWCEGRTPEVSGADDADPRTCPHCGLPLEFKGDICRRCMKRGALLVRVLRLMRPYVGKAAGMMALVLVLIGLRLVPQQLVAPHASRSSSFSVRQPSRRPATARRYRRVSWR